MKDLNKDKCTIKDVAKEANVSVATISRYFNDHAKLDSNTALMLEQVIKRLDYKPNRAAQMLNTRKSGFIVQIVPDITNPFYACMTKEINIYARAKGYTVVLCDTNEIQTEEYNAIKLASENMAEGIIITSLYETESLVKDLKASKIPVVITNSIGDGNFDTVYSLGNGTYYTTKYLIELGHKMIAYVGGRTGSSVENKRRNSYIRALKEAGITPSQDLIFEMDFSEDCGYKAGKYISSFNQRPTAVCCANDLIAMGLMKSLQDQKIKVPDEISVIGMDNIPLADKIHPRLTTVTNDGAEHGRKAAKLLFERISDNYSEDYRRIIIDEEIVERDSTAKYQQIY